FAHASYVLDIVLVELDRPEEAVHSLRSLEIYTELGSLSDQAMVLNNMAHFATSRWEWDEALRLYALAAECAERAGEPGQLAVIAGGVLVAVEAFGGDPSRALEIVRDAREADSRELPLLQRARGVALARMGRDEEALQALDASLALAREQGALYHVAATLDIL